MRYFFSLYLLFFLSGFALAQPGADLHLEDKILTTASGLELEAQLGYLSVKENRENPASAIIKLPFVRLKSKAAEPISPVFYLEGGPGSSSTWMAENPRALDNWAPLLELGDVVLFDQRGTGAASERLTWINFSPIPEDVLVTEAAAEKYYLNLVAPAQEAWKKAGVDLAGYTTLESAKDMDALRQAMGLPQISVLGFSYGTHLGQAYMKYFEGNLDKAILVGTEGLAENFKLPLRMDAQFRKLAAMVAADEAVSKDIPDLVALYERVSKKLAANPVTLTLNSPLTREEMKMKLGKFGLDYILFRDLGDASDLPVIPRLLYSMDQGDYEAFTWFVQKRVSGLYGLHAMAVTMDIASGISPERMAVITRQRKESMFGNVLNTPYLAIKETWNAPDLGPEYRADFTSSVPTLLLSGTLDMNTPPFQAERLRWNLPNAQHIIVENAGHEQIQSHPAIQRAIATFLAGGDVRDVTASYPPLKFIPVKGERDGVWHPAVSKK